MHIDRPNSIVDHETIFCEGVLDFLRAAPGVMEKCETCWNLECF